MPYHYLLGNAIMTTMKCHISVRMTKMKMTIPNAGEVVEKLLMGMLNVTTILETTWQFLKMLKIHSYQSYDPVIPFLGNKRAYIHARTCT